MFLKSIPISIKILFLVLIVGFTLFYLLSSDLGNNGRKSPGNQTISNMYQLRPAQEMFYELNHRYADTQEELIEAGFLTEKFIDEITNKELADRDGTGIDGSDNDPKTWLVTSHIDDFWFTCNQGGCYKEH